MNTTTTIDLTGKTIREEDKRTIAALMYRLVADGRHAYRKDRDGYQDTLSAIMLDPRIEGAAARIFYPGQGEVVSTGLAVHYALIAALTDHAAGEPLGTTSLNADDLLSSFWVDGAGADLARRRSVNGAYNALFG
jgi:hypothetical protein